MHHEITLRHNTEISPEANECFNKGFKRKTKKKVDKLPEFVNKSYVKNEIGTSLMTFLYRTMLPRGVCKDYFENHRVQAEKEGNEIASVYIERNTKQALVFKHQFQIVKEQGMSFPINGPTKTYHQKTSSRKCSLLILACHSILSITCMNIEALNGRFCTTYSTNQTLRGYLKVRQRYDLFL